jgi:hypothetical protein
MKAWMEWEVKHMKNKLSKWWFLVVLAIPFLLMLCLHIGIALGNYFGVNINVPNVDASTWFIFCGSYLGGTMTLAGVMITLKHERSIHQYEKVLDSIDKEKDALGKAVCNLNIFAPSTIYQRFNSLRITNEGYNSAEVAAIRQQLAEEMQKINAAKLEAMLFTDAYIIPAGCTNCKTPCRIPTILPEFQKTYEKVENRTFTLLQMIDSYIVICNQNALRKALIANCQQANQQCQAFGQPPKYDESEIKRYENEIINTESQQNEIIVAITEIGKYTQMEIPQLTALVREYVAVKQKNAYKNCFPVKEGK